MINKDTLSLMKNNAFLINTSRGALVDEEALISSLKAKEIGGAFLDVTEVEPPEEGSPLYELENVIITPHMGWKGLETRKRLLSIVKDI
jgi:glycerate dehydrogenase